MTSDLYNEQQRLESVLNKIESSNISKSNKNRLVEFKNHCVANGVGKNKISRYLYDMIHIASKGKNSTDAQIVSVISKRIIEEVHFVDPPFELEMNSSILYYKNCFMGGWDNKSDQEVLNESKKSS